MGFVRIGTGPDAADVAFATLFDGDTASHAPMVRAIAVEDAQQGLERPRHCDLALSTDGCRAAQAG